MSDISGGGYTRSDHAEVGRWWSVGYAVRLAVAMVLAGAVVGAILGPVGLLLGQLSVAWSGGSLSYPAWMYGQAALLQATLGVLIGSSGSLAMVLLLPRPATRRALLLRIAAGPMIAGGLLIVLSLFWGATGLPSLLLQTAFGCAVFVLAGMLARSTRIESIVPE
jgi:hypothetical protein